MKLPAELPPIDPARLMPKVETGVPHDVLQKLADTLMAAKNPLILVGRVTRDLNAWNERVALAEALAAKVASSMHCGAGFPTDHPLHVEPPTTFNGPELNKAIIEADVIVSLDWVDLAGAMKFLGAPPRAKVIQVSMDHTVHNGWSMDHMALPYADMLIAADVDVVVKGLLDIVSKSGKRKPAPAAAPAKLASDYTTTGPLTSRHLGIELKKAVGERKTSLTHLPITWNGEWLPFHHPLDYLGNDGGGGLGAGPGTSVGSALALKGSGRLPICICGDGDFLMGVTAIWTAVHYRIPLLVVVANNSSFYRNSINWMNNSSFYWSKVFIKRN